MLETHQWHNAILALKDLGVHKNRRTSKRAMTTQCRKRSDELGGRFFDGNQPRCLGRASDKRTALNSL